MFEFLKSLDRSLFLFLNGKHNAFFDFVMYWASNRFVWIPFYALLLFVLIKTFGRKTIFILVLIAAMITVSDQVASGLVKNQVHRLRPCHNPEIAAQVHLVNGECGGQFGYFSSHASNTFALAVFLILIFRRRIINPHVLRDTNGGASQPLHLALLAYAILVSYSRIYLGAHYPADVFTGIVFGTLLSFIFARIYFRFQNNFFHEK